MDERGDTFMDLHVLTRGNSGTLFDMKQALLEDETSPANSALARQQEILRLVDEEGFVSVSDLASRLDVSDMSIRRDALVLNEQGLVRKVRGGLLRVAEETSSGSTSRIDSVSGAQVAIAQRAIELVGDTDVVVIDAGRNAFEFAKALPESFHGTVISHSLPVLDYMQHRPAITTISLGGELFRRSRAFVGSSAINATKELRATTFFMGAAAADVSGIYASLDIEKELKRALVGIAQEVVLLVEHTKFDVMAPVFLTDWDSRFSVVCDELPNPNNVAALEAKGVTFYTA